MCNPRRVRVHATRKIAEAWRAEIKQAATARGDVSAEARLVQAIDDLLPPPARQAFEQAMRDAPDWVWTGTEYRKSVPGGTVVYRPDTGELEIVVELHHAIEAVGTATLVATGEITDEVSATATGTYYGGAKEAAKKRARVAAATEVDQLAVQRSVALKQQAEETARYELSARTGEAAAEARRTAQQRLTLQASELQPGLDEQANEQLEVVQAETLTGIFQLVATGYSNAIQAYAAEHGENLQVSEGDGIIAIEFELER